MRPLVTSRRPHGGFTLLELLLVLAILVAVSALAVPALQRPLESYRLRRAADLVCAQWVRARNAAIETGEIQVFYFEQDGGQYWYQPWGSAADAAGESQPAGGAGGGGHLPKGIRFASGQSAGDTRQAAIDEAFTTAGVSGGTPIVFYPDGTTSDAEVVLANEEGQTIRIELRALTGIAHVGDVEAGEDAGEEVQP